MFNNWINHEEIFYLFNKIRNDPQRFLKFASKLYASDSEKVRNTWSMTNIPPTNWWDIPAVQSRWNYLVSGDKDIDYNDYISEKFLKEKHSLQALSLGCGGGEREFRWAETNKFSLIDAYDLSPERVDYATKIANQSRYNKQLNYQVCNIYEVDIKDYYYDVILQNNLYIISHL